MGTDVSMNRCRMSEQSNQSLCEAIPSNRGEWLDVSQTCHFHSHSDNQTAMVALAHVYDCAEEPGRPPEGGGLGAHPPGCRAEKLSALAAMASTLLAMASLYSVSKRLVKS